MTLFWYKSAFVFRIQTYILKKVFQKYLRNLQEKYIRLKDIYNYF